MSNPDLKALAGAQFAQVSEPEPRQVPLMDPSRFTQHPISEAEAQNACRCDIGLTRFPRRLRDYLPIWWAKLCASETPEEMLTCERMINAINVCIGLHSYELGRKIAEANVERQNRENAEESAATRAAAEAAAIDRWRRIR